MPKSRGIEKQNLPQKTLWHPYGLQSLATEKFIKIVNLILKGEHILLGFKRGKSQEEKIAHPSTPEEKLPETVH